VRHDGKIERFFGIVEKVKASGAAVTWRRDLCSCSMDQARDLAALDEKCGISAVYLPLHDAPYWTDHRFDDFLRFLRSLGHEIGAHHDSIAPWLAKLTPPRETLERALARLRRSGDVAWSAAHGSPGSYSADGRLRYVAYEAFSECDPKKNVAPAAAWKMPRVSAADLGVREFYFEGHTAYLSDSGNVFHGWYRVEGAKPFERYNEIDIGLGVLDRLTPQDRIVILQHPAWWRVGGER
jgi:hypothetical protein